MKKFIILTMAFCLLALTSCKKDPTDTTPPQLTEVEKQQIVSSYTSIDEVASEILLNFNDESSFEALGEQFKNYPMVEKISAEKTSLVVSFKKGGVIIWKKTNEDIIPPYYEFTTFKNNSFKKNKGETNENMPHDKRVCFINQQSRDQNLSRMETNIKAKNDLINIFQNSDYAFSSIDANELNINWLKNQFNKYGVIYFTTHGYCEVTNEKSIWLATGTECYLSNGEVELFFNNNGDWSDGRISIMKIDEYRSGVKVSIPYIGVSNKFFSKYSGDFPNSIVYFTACEGMKSNKMSATWIAKGAGSVVGWNGINCIGKSSGVILYSYMMGGLNLEDAIAKMPSEAKFDSDEGCVSWLTKDGNPKMYLVDTTDAIVYVTSLQNNGVYSDRTVKLEGYLSEVIKLIAGGTVEVNGIATTLKILNGSEYFSQYIDLKSGENIIKINCVGELENGKHAFATKEMKITGNFPALALYSQLRWNTNNSDIDFHLLPPNSSINDLWSTKDCYYSNMSTYWGAYLDFDNIYGYGPEHITIPNEPAPGIYTLYVHYYSGYPSTKATINVQAKNGTEITINPQSLNYSGGDYGGDVIEVCTIEYPSGAIITKNILHSFGKNSVAMNNLLRNKKRK